MVYSENQLFGIQIHIYCRDPDTYIYTYIYHRQLWIQSCLWYILKTNFSGSRYIYIVGIQIHIYIHIYTIGNSGFRVAYGIFWKPTFRDPDTYIYTYIYHRQLWIQSCLWYILKTNFSGSEKLVFRIQSCNFSGSRVAKFWMGSKDTPQKMQFLGAIKKVV